jgi:hypothetical protein
MRVRLDPKDHGYGERPDESVEPGELELDRSCDQTDIEVDYDQRPRRARRRS